MVTAIRPLLIGDRFDRLLGLLSAAVVCLGTLVAYATGVFGETSGVVVLPSAATLVGCLVAATVGYRRGGAVAAWGVVFAALFGFNADWAFFGLSGRTLAERLAFLFDPTTIAVFGTAAILLGSIAFAAGYAASLAVERVADASPDA